jgi:hypothetical protein
MGKRFQAFRHFLRHSARHHSTDHPVKLRSYSDLGVAGYVDLDRVHRHCRRCWVLPLPHRGTVGYTTGTSYLFSALTCNTSYTLGVQASDAAGNLTPLASMPLGSTTWPSISMSPPSNTALPLVTGIPVQGQTLAASTGTSNSTPTSYAYQWQDCATSGCTDSTGATSSNLHFHQLRRWCRDRRGRDRQ